MKAEKEIKGTTSKAVEVFKQYEALDEPEQLEFVTKLFQFFLSDYYGREAQESEADNMIEMMSDFLSSVSCNDYLVKHHFEICEILKQQGGIIAGKGEKAISDAVVLYYAIGKNFNEILEASSMFDALREGREKY